MGAPATSRAAAHDDDEAWAAVLGRDAAYDGRFVYGVSSTRIYCRPVCPSRRPQRRRVTFFAGPGEAERAGYRACRRCDPRRERVASPPPAVQRAREYLDAHYDEPVTLARLAREAGMSAHHLQRTFARIYGVSPREYQASLRLDRFKRELRNGAKVTTAIYEAGYGSPSRVYETSTRHLGMAPGTYRKGGRGASIRYSIVRSPFGRVMAAATEAGLCSVALGDDDTSLETALKTEYPLAEIHRDAGAIDAWLRAIVRSVETTGALDAVPLDLRGTAFQLRVWNAIRAIPRGTTRTYAEIAAAIGQPAAARAVARACAANRLALVVPCHRVVRQDGDPAGYRWGAARKRTLLAREAAKR